MTTIYLLRHGALAGDSRERFVGQIDLPLAPEGIRQAETLAEALRDHDIAALHCSDLQRCRQTAGIIAGALHVPVTEHSALREISLGDWEGLPRREVAERWADQFAARGRNIEHYRPPGGESFADCLARALPIWEAILHGSHEAVAVIGHAGLNRVLLCHVLGLPIADMFRIGQDYGCINIVERNGDRSWVKLVNGSPSDLVPTEPQSGTAAHGSTKRAA
jgi:probable phosphoglycerate mutase